MGLMKLRYVEGKRDPVIDHPVLQADE